MLLLVSALIFREYIILLNRSVFLTGKNIKRHIFYYLYFFKTGTKIYFVFSVMEIRYRIIKEHHLVVHKYTGKFSIDDYKYCVKKIMDLPEWAYVRKVLNDLRGMDLKQSIVHMNELIKIRQEIIIKDLNTVLLVDNPEATASAHLYMEKLMNKYRIGYCSTIEYAIELLNIKLSQDEMEDILNNLDLIP